MLGKVNCENESECGRASHMTMSACHVISLLTESLCQHMFRINKYPTIKLVRNGQVSHVTACEQHCSYSHFLFLHSLCGKSIVER